MFVSAGLLLPMAFFSVSGKIICYADDADRDEFGAQVGAHLVGTMRYANDLIDIVQYGRKVKH